MKKQYINPNTTAVAFYAGSICQATSPSPSSSTTIGGNAGLGTGGNSGGTIDPL